MRLFLGFEIFHTYVAPGDITRLRAEVGAVMQEWQQSGRLEAGGVFPGNRRGFAVIKVDSEEDAFDALGNLADFASVETFPVVRFETLGRFFAEHPAAVAAP